MDHFLLSIIEITVMKNKALESTFWQMKSQSATLMHAVKTLING